LTEISILSFCKALKTIANLVNVNVMKKSELALAKFSEIKRNLLVRNGFAWQGFGSGGLQKWLL